MLNSSGNYSDEGNAVEYFAKLEDKRYDKNTPSSVEMSQAIATDILHIVESTKTMPSDSKKFLPNSSFWDFRTFSYRFT